MLSLPFKQVIGSGEGCSATCEGWIYFFSGEGTDHRGDKTWGNKLLFYNGVPIQKKPPRDLKLRANVPPTPGRRQNYFLAWRKLKINCTEQSEPAATEWLLVSESKGEWAAESFRVGLVGRSAVSSGILQDMKGKWAQRCGISCEASQRLPWHFQVYDDVYHIWKSKNWPVCKISFGWKSFNKSFRLPQHVKYLIASTRFYSKVKENKTMQLPWT